jgi:DNA-binding transcriptional LysR family regulator
MENSLSSHFPVSHPESASARSKLRLATFDMVASSWIAPKLPNLRLKCPDLEIELVSAFEYVDLEKLDADLSVSCSRPARSRLMHMKLGYLNFSVYGSREYLRARPLLSSDDLTGHDLLLYYKDLAPLQEAGWFQRASRECKVALTSNCSLSLLHAAEEGLGLAVLPVCMAARSSHLIRINPRTVSRHELWLAYHPDLKKDRSVREMVEFLKSLACDETAPI